MTAHLCTEVKKQNEKFTDIIVKIKKPYNNWFLEMTPGKHYSGDSIFSIIKYCPFCGKELK